MQSPYADSSDAPIRREKDATERVVGNGEGSQSTQAQPSIGELATSFIEKLKRKFGDSQETATIFATLGDFQHRKSSKRETLSIISKTLGTQYDLKRDLMKVLEHKDARWGADDFDLPLMPLETEMPVETQLPLFLQPAHEPQMRFPSLSTPWSSNNGLLANFGTPVLNHLAQYPEFKQPAEREVPMMQQESDVWHAPSRALLPSPAISEPHTDLPYVHLTTPDNDHAPNFPACSQSENFGVIMPHTSEGDAHQQFDYLETWDRLPYGSSWNEKTLIQHGRNAEHDGNHQETYPVEAFEILGSDESRPGSGLESVTAAGPQQSVDPSPEALVMDSYALKFPNNTSALIDDSIVEMPPPSNKRKRGSSMLKYEVNDYHVDNTAVHDSSIGESQSALMLHPDTSQSSIPPRERSQSEDCGQYIHSLCGKSFGTRSAVKKHHWGKKMDNLNTTTGCWYKHKKPNISWNDHPSCKDVPKPTPLRSHRVSSTSEGSKAPVVPAMVPSYRNTVLGFPILQNLPHTVAKAVEPSQTSSLFVPNGFVNTGPMHENHLLYHTHSLPRAYATPGSPFESLLTVVNVAAKIEEPTPKGRTDSSVICNLDAQAIAAEREGRYRRDSAYAPGSQFKSLDHDQKFLPSPGDYSLGAALSSPTQYAQTSMTFVPQWSDRAYTLPTVSPPVSDP